MIPQWAALVLAFGFGLFYNWLVGRWERRPDTGAVSLWVVGGVLMTLLFASLPTTTSARLLLYWQGEPLQLTNAQHASVHVFIFFVATGIPMVLGSFYRFWQRSFPHA